MGSFRPGSLGPVDLLNITSIARAVDARGIFEIGTFNGVTALTLAMNCPAATVYTLDLEPGVAPSMPTERIDADLISEAPSRIYQGHPAATRVVQLLGDSATFDFGQFHGSCDLVFIDGAHSAEYVSNDTDIAFRLITERSAVVWDDYWRMAPAVVKYLDSRTDLRLQRLAGTRLVAWVSDSARQHLGLD